MKTKKNVLLFSFLAFLFVSLIGPTKSDSQTTQKSTREEIEFDAKLKDIANNVNELKEKVYKSKSKLKLLEETLLLGKITGSRAIVRFKDKTGGFFNLMAGEYYLNGKLIYKFGKGKNFPGNSVIFDGEAPPGNNKLRVKLTFTGNDSGALKLFSYFKDYKFNLESKHEFPVSYGKTTALQIESIDLGPLKNKLEDRLSVQYSTVTEEKSTLPF